MSTMRTKLASVAAICAAAIGGGAIANAATSTSTTATPSATSAPSTQPPQGPHTLNGKTEQALSGDTAAKVKEAALGKVSGAVDRVETNVDSSAPYEAHITKADGSQVTVEVNGDFTVASVQAMPAHP